MTSERSKISKTGGNTYSSTKQRLELLTNKKLADKNYQESQKVGEQNVSIVICSKQMN